MLLDVKPHDITSRETVTFIWITFSTNSISPTHRQSNSISSGPLTVTICVASSL